MFVFVTLSSSVSPNHISLQFFGKVHVKKPRSALLLIVSASSVDSGNGNPTVSGSSDAINPAKIAKTPINTLGAGFQ